MIKFRSIFISLALALALCSGCDFSEDRTEKMRDSPVMKEAIDAERRGDFDKAIVLYADVASMYPTEASPCLQLALLLHDHKHDYLGAIYNYQRFVKNAKTFQDQQELAIISNRMNKAKLSVAQELLRTISSSSASPEVKAFQDFTKLNAELTKLQSEKAEIVEENKKKDKEIASLKSTVTHLELAIEKMKSSGVAGSGKLASRAGVLTPYEYTNELGKVKSGMTYQVESSDNLSKIANKVYGDASMWPRISAANADKIDKSNTVKVGDILLIPWP